MRPLLRQIWEKTNFFSNPLTPYSLITYLSLRPLPVLSAVEGFDSNAHLHPIIEGHYVYYLERSVFYAIFVLVINFLVIRICFGLVRRSFSEGGFRFFC